MASAERPSPEASPNRPHTHCAEVKGSLSPIGAFLGSGGGPLNSHYATRAF